MGKNDKGKAGSVLEEGQGSPPLLLSMAMSLIVVLEFGLEFSEPTGVTASCVHTACTGWCMRTVCFPHTSSVCLYFNSLLKGLHNIKRKAALQGKHPWPTFNATSWSLCSRGQLSPTALTNSHDQGVWVQLQDSNQNNNRCNYYLHVF